MMSESLRPAIAVTCSAKLWPRLSATGYKDLAGFYRSILQMNDKITFLLDIQNLCGSTNLYTQALNVVLQGVQDSPGFFCIRI